MIVATVIHLSVFFFLINFAQSVSIDKRLADGGIAPDQYRFVVTVEAFSKENNDWVGTRLTGTLVKDNNKFAVVTSAHIIGLKHNQRLLAAEPLNNNFMKFSRPIRITFGSNVVLRHHSIILSPESRICIFPRRFMDMDGYGCENIQMDFRFDVIFIPIFPSEAKQIIEGNGEFLDWSNLPTSYADYMKIDNCKIVTFGTTVVNVTAQELHFAELQPIPIDKCETDEYIIAMWKSQMDQYQNVCHRTLFTAKPRLPTVMPGDSGSPIMCSIGGRNQLLFICSGVFQYLDDSYVRSVDSKVIFDYYRLAMQLF